jgi:SAM-dependent MidA family methyltransferase
MTDAAPLERELRKLLDQSDLSFRDFVELALYHPEHGYYSGQQSPVGKDADYVTGPSLSPVFAFALSKLVGEFVRRCEAEVCSIVDIGAGDGALIINLYALADAQTRQRARFFGIDRSLGRVGSSESAEERRGTPRDPEEPSFASSIDSVPRDAPALILSNELFDAFPFARLVRRDEHIHELWVTERDGALDWKEYEASPVWEDYFAARGIELDDGQFADVSPEWEAFYGDVAARFERSLIVTFDYGFRAPQLFHKRIRRFGTAAAYRRQRVTRDLLVDPGRQDLTAHVNFSDLERAGQARGARTLFFDRQAKFLLALGITAHPLFTPVQDVPISSVEEGVRLIDEREEARRLVLPDGIGHDIHVLVQGKGVPLEGWSFEQQLW